MNGSSDPAMSVVLLVPYSYRAIRRTMAHLRAQAGRERLEIVFVAPSAEALGLDPPDLEGFHSCRVVPFDPLTATGAARAAGVRAARAPVVVFAEDHCFPQPGWAEALLEAHRGPWTVVGPTLGNANPRGMLSWAILLLGFGPCVERRTAGEAQYTAWHNSSYKRAALLELGDRLDDLFEAEGLLQQELLARGHSLCLEPSARALHLNTSGLRSWVRELFLGGRIFAGLRARPWSLGRRFLYCLGAPLIPLVRLPRLLRNIRQTSLRERLIPRILPSLGVGLVIHAFGEMTGYACGTGSAMRGYLRTEFQKERGLCRREQREWAVS